MLKWKKNLYTVWFTQILSLVGFGFGIPFLPFFIQEMGITDPSELKLWTGILNSVTGLFLALMAPLWGYLADRLGKKLMLVRAMLSASIILAGLGFSKTVYAVLIFRILQGAFTGTVTSSATLVASGTPNNRLSFALGFLSSSTFIGISLGPAIGGIVAEYFGYRLSFFIGSGIMLNGFFLALLLLKEPQHTEEPKLESERNGTAGIKSLISPVLISLFIILFFVRLSRQFPIPFMPLYIQELRSGIEGSARLTGLISGGIGLASAISGLTLSRLGDRLNKVYLLSLFTGVGVIASGLIFILPGTGGLAASLFITYFLIGGVEPMVMSLTSEQVHSGKRGLLFGIQTLFSSLAWFFSPMLGSWVSINFSNGTVFRLLPFLLFITFLISIISGKTTLRKIHTSDQAMSNSKLDS